MKWLLAVTLAALAVGAGSAYSADTSTKQLPAGHAVAKLTVKPGQIVRWQSPRIGPVNRLSLAIAGREAFYQPEPKTRNCVAYGYEAGVAIRITDCRKGVRVPYVRVRAVSAALKPVAFILRLN